MSAGHSHDHSGGAIAHRPRLAIAFDITAAILIAEVIGAVITGSLALLVDAAHMLTDAAGLLMALTAATLMGRPATDRRTWGFRRAEVLSATAQSTLLLAVGLYAMIDGVRRLFAPPEVAAGGLLVFGIIGLLGNVIAIVVLSSGRGANLNMRAAFLEVVNDALGSVAVIVGAIVIQTTGWMRADALAAMFISALILPRAYRLLRETTSILLESTPRGLDLEEVRGHLLSHELVLSVHDLHASQIATGLPVLTAHVVVRDAAFHDGRASRVLDSLQACVAGHFDVSIEHSTFQIEAESHSDHEQHFHP